MAKRSVVITLSEFRNKLPEILARVHLRSETFVITKHGKPVARVDPPPSKKE